MINTNVMAKLMKKKDSIKLKKPIYIYDIHYIHFSKRNESFSGVLQGYLRDDDDVLCKNNIIIYNNGYEYHCL
jgi:hypothetical protein